MSLLALLDSVSRAAAMARVSVVVRPASVNAGLLESVAMMQAKICGKLPIHHIPITFFLLFFDIGSYGTEI